MTWDQLDPAVEREVKRLLGVPGYVEQLDAQAAEWNPERWLRTFVREKSILDRLARECPISDRGYRSLSRGRVLELASEGEPMLTFMAAMIWGFGTAGRIEWLAGRALGYRGDASLTHGEACRRVRSAHEVVQRDPIEAFHLMVPGSGRNHLPGLGMSFATKFLYFAGFAAALNRGGAPPLVLDQYVTVALLGSQRRTTDSSNYEAYIRMAHVLDEKRPDAVESALFGIGRERSAGRSREDR